MTVGAAVIDPMIAASTNERTQIPTTTRRRSKKTYRTRRRMSLGTIWISIMMHCPRDFAGPVNITHEVQRRLGRWGLLRMHRRRSVVQKIRQDLHAVRNELLLHDRIDSVTRRRSRFAVGEDVFADHLIPLKANDELDAAAEVDRSIKTVTPHARQL